MARESPVEKFSTKISCKIHEKRIIAVADERTCDSLVLIARDLREQRTNKGHPEMRVEKALSLFFFSGLTEEIMNRK